MRTKAKQIKELETQLENARFIIEIYKKRNAILQERLINLQKEYDRLKNDRRDS